MKAVVVAIGLCAAWLWWRDGGHAPVQTVQQAAVLADGFALTDGHKVFELAPDGRRRATLDLPYSGALRVFGTRVGVAAGWIERGAVRVVDVKSRREIGAWGQSARGLCDGVATNDARFAIAWFEGDGKLWFVHGPTSPAIAAVDEPTFAGAADEPAWCAVASADDKIALAWRQGDRLLINTCTQRKCSPLPGSTKLARSQKIIGMGCVRNACLVATTKQILYVAESGAVKWRKDLPANMAQLSIVGIGNSAFAVGYPGSVRRVERSGATKQIWSGAGTPSLAWSNGRLLVAHARGETVLEVQR